jgi:hypothetical protein
VKLSIIVAVVYGGLMLVQIAFMIPIVPLQWGVLFAVLGNLVRAWIWRQNDEARRQAVWGKYDMPSSSKGPTYHDL